MSGIPARAKYLFDLNGYLIVRGVFSSEEVLACNNIIDQRVSQFNERNTMIRNTKAGTPLEGDGHSGRKDLGGILEWGNDSKIFSSVLNHPTLVPYYHEFLGRGYRMDHLPFVIAQDKGSEGFALHGGTVDCRNGQYNPSIAYSCVQGKIHNQLMAVAVVLSHHNAGDGGFIVVRGSHKANFAAPADMVNGFDTEFVDQPVTQPGDVVMFSEGTAHGARPWTAEHQRRVALYRFSPATVGYGRSYYPAWPSSITTHMSPEQLAVLEPPYSERLDRPLLTEEGQAIVVCEREAEKKLFDKQVFGTQYF